jgi:DNA adenine methylase
VLPQGHRLIEPFVGSGAVFLAAPYNQYIINDANSDLIALWTALQCRPKECIEQAQAFFVQENLSQAAYLRIRAEFNASSDRFERAVRLPYLNRFGFNGLFRTNRSGGFNVPYGRPASVPGFPWDAMASAAQKLDRTLIMGGGFEAALDLAGVCDVVYCDPPYLDSNAGASFTGYTSKGFTREDHEQLVEAAVKAAGRGAHVLISNHDTPETRELYRGWHIETLEVRRSISAKSASRAAVRELVAVLPAPIADIAM